MGSRPSEGVKPAVNYSKGAGGGDWAVEGDVVSGS